jgi:hypothetical protein
VDIEDLNLVVTMAYTFCSVSAVSNPREKSMWGEDLNSNSKHLISINPFVAIDMKPSIEKSIGEMFCFEWLPRSNSKHVIPHFAIY